MRSYTFFSEKKRESRDKELHIFFSEKNDAQWTVMHKKKIV